ncbi:hypothetical protein [Arcobacter aquimarinus]|uniref:Uncharacterized protein n=1 Tax=Arcobacter aquimarinus TaxID=1315211 RepID=A0AAE7E0Y2_9BACT|nr:hypothetical protein [Arcobacter aquimarinus]MCB9097312.1 hypothetical protein [Arcobacter sp.]QKE25342.1 hypothetical protein AAQM_0577 [Arcobacter aquimarinus]RXI31224.1 hypothetical protein CP986_11605 [Arcobacter aquimarinus]
MKLLLICETAIIEHIFTLVCKRLNIDLSIQKTTTITDKFDVIVVDQNFIDDKFNSFKQFTKKLAAISSEELPFDKSRDFIIPRPFLPTKLESLLIEQKEIIKEEEEYEKNRKVTTFTSYDLDENDEEVTIPVVNYISNLEEENNSSLDDEDYNFDEGDESIVSLESLNTGGVLDSSELTRINDILREDSIQNEINLEKNDWKDISSIIDDALAEVKEYEFDLKEPMVKPYNLILSNFNINELRPLLEKLDQSIIDKLSSGDTVDIRISLKDK